MLSVANKRYVMKKKYIQVAVKMFYRYIIDESGEGAFPFADNSKSETDGFFMECWLFLRRSHRVYRLQTHTCQTE